MHICAPIAHFAHFHIISYFRRNLTQLARTAQRTLEAETLQKVVQGRVDLQKIIAVQNELKGIRTVFAQTSN